MGQSKIENLMAPPVVDSSKKAEVKTSNQIIAKPVLYAVAEEVRSELFQLGHRLESAIDLTKDACSYEAGTEVGFRVGEAYVYLRNCLAELREMEQQLSIGLKDNNNI